MSWSRLACAVGLGWLAFGTASAQTFAPATTYPMPGAGGRLVLVDLNGDGYEDAVASQLGASGAIVVAHGDGLGGFGSVANFPAGAILDQPLPADLNLDGLLDFLSADSTASKIRTILGTAGGGFAAGPAFTTGTSPMGPSAGDLTGDGIPDLVVANYSPNTLSVLVATAPVSYAPAKIYGVGSQPRSTAIADFNADGKRDVMYGDAAGVKLSLGDGSGAVGSGATVATAASADAIQTPDLDGDGKLDFVATTSNWQGGNGFVYRYGAGNGTFPVGSGVASSGFGQIAFGDVSEDGQTDFVSGGSFVTVWSIVAKTVIQWQKGFDPGLGAGFLVSGAGVADVNRDGRNDVVFVGNSNVGVLTGVGSITFVSLGSAPVGSLAKAIALGDLDRDGRPDLVTANSDTAAAGSCSLFPGLGDGTFGTASIFARGASAESIALGDLDGDGWLDAVLGVPYLTPGNYGEFSILRNDQAGGFAPPATTGSGLVNQRIVGLSDVDLDGDLDVLAAGSQWPGNNWHYLSVHLGDGNGGVATGVQYLLAPNNTQSFTSVGIGDLNGDAHPDVALATSSGISLTLGGIGGVFGAPTWLLSGTNVYSLCLGDFDGDARMDLAASQAQGNSALNLWIGDGLGGFHVSNVPGNFQTYEVRAVDMNGDGRLDVFGPESGDLVLNYGFPTSSRYQGPNAVRCALADLDSDGLPDFVIPSNYTIASKLTKSLGIPNTIAYGAGTPGCAGRLGVAATGYPVVGNAFFGIGFTNAPALAPGLVFVGNAQDTNGQDVFGIGTQFLVDPLASTELYVLTAASAIDGSSVVAAAIPNIPALVGSAYFAQAYFVEGATNRCSASAIHLVSSRALAITLIP